MQDPQSQQTTVNQSHYTVNWSEMVSRTLELWKRRLPSYAVIMGIVSVVVYAAFALLLTQFIGPDGVEFLVNLSTNPFSIISQIRSLPIALMTQDQLLRFVPFVIFTIILFSIAGGAAIKLAFEDYDSPGEGGVVPSFSYSASRIIPLMAVQIIGGLIIFMLQLPSLLVVMFLLLSGIGLVEVSLLGFLAFIPSMYIGTRLTPASAIVIAEDIGIIGALTKSWRISDGHFWHILGGQILLGFVIAIVSFFIQGAIVTAFLQISRAVGIFLAVVILSTLFDSLNYIFQAVLYRDLQSKSGGTI